MVNIDLEAIERLESGAAIIIGDKPKYVIAREGDILKMFKVIDEF